MYLTSLSINNLRSIKSADLNLRAPGLPADSPSVDFLPNVNLLLGDNGSGKTTVLKALALAVLAPVISDSGFRPYYLVRRDAKDQSANVYCKAILHEQDIASMSSKSKVKGNSKKVETAAFSVVVQRKGDHESVSAGPGSLSPTLMNNLFYENTPAFFIVAYGATRRVDDSPSFVPPDQSRSRSARYQRVAGLFEPQVALVPLSSWLTELSKTNHGRYTQVQHLLNALLPTEAKFLGTRLGAEFLFKVNGEQVPFAAMSDGFRAYISWISDLLYQIVRTCPSGMKLRDNRGLVLVDEVDLHLHPSWQRTIIGTLAKQLPNLQFVLTSHSPIVAASLHRQNVFVMSTDDQGCSTVVQLEERIYGLSADQALESSYFLLPTTRSESFVKEISRRTGQLDRANPKAALELMDRLSGKLAPTPAKAKVVGQRVKAVAKRSSKTIIASSPHGLAKSSTSSARKKSLANYRSVKK